jgi:hypothetical protein
MELSLNLRRQILVTAASYSSRQGDTRHGNFSQAKTKNEGALDGRTYYHPRGQIKQSN